MILDAFKFTNNLFSTHFSKYFLVIFPIFIITFVAYLLMPSVPGNEFGTTSSFNYQDLVTNLFLLYATILTILLTDDIYKERKRNISNYFSIGAFLYFKVLLISINSTVAIILALIPFITISIYITSSPVIDDIPFVISLVLFLLLLPALYILARITFAIYLAVVFNERIFKSFKKSFEITQGKAWDVLGYILVLVIPITFIFMLLLTGPALLLLPGNLTAFIGLTSLLSFIITVYITIYIYRLLINLTNTSNESF